jgi:hypothetical protein
MQRYSSCVIEHPATSHILITAMHFHDLFSPTAFARRETKYILHCTLNSVHLAELNNLLRRINEENQRSMRHSKAENFIMQSFRGLRKHWDVPLANIAIKIPKNGKVRLCLRARVAGQRANAAAMKECRHRFTTKLGWLISLTNNTYEAQRGAVIARDIVARARARAPLSRDFFRGRTLRRVLCRGDFSPAIYIARRDTIACTRNCALVRTQLAANCSLPFYVAAAVAAIYVSLPRRSR